MNASQFDGSAAFYGGGFMAPSANPTPEQSFFPSKVINSPTIHCLLCLAPMEGN